MMFDEEEVTKEIEENGFSNKKKFFIIGLIILITSVAIYCSQVFLKMEQEKQKQKIKSLFIESSKSKKAVVIDEVEVIESIDKAEKPIDKVEKPKEIDINSTETFNRFTLSIDIKFPKGITVSKAIADLKKLSGIICTSPSVESMVVKKVAAQDKSGNYFDISLEKEDTQ